MFTNIKKGGKCSVQRVNRTKQVNTKLDLKKSENFTSLGLSLYNSIYNLDSPRDTTLMLNYWSGSKLFVQMKKPEGLFYNLVDPKDSEQIELDFTKINKSFQSKDFNHPSFIRGGFSQVYGVIENGDQFEEYFINFSNIPNNSEKSTLIYPANSFSKYATAIMLKTDNHISYSMGTIGDIPSSFEKLAAEAKVESENFSNFKISFSGNFDEYQAGFANDDRSYISIHSQASFTKFKLPEFGEAIGEPGFKLKDLTIKDLSLFDRDNFVDDASYNKFYNEDTTHVSYDNRPAMLLSSRRTWWY